MVKATGKDDPSSHGLNGSEMGNECVRKTKNEENAVVKRGADKDLNENILH